MKTLFLSALLFSTSLHSSFQLNAQWQQRALPGQSVHGLLTNGSLTYGGSGSTGFHLSTNDGVSWTQMNNGLTSGFVKAFAVSGSNLFAGTNGPAGMYLTTNNGTNWTIVNTGLTNMAVHSLALSGSTLLAGTNGGGVFITTNNGGSWQASNTGLPGLAVHALLVVGSRILAGTDLGVGVSTDNGASWSLPATSPTALRSLAASGSTIIAATFSTGVFKSTDNGDTWVASNIGMTTLAGRVVIGRSGNFFTGTNGGGVYLSTDNGTSWSRINTGLTDSSILSLAVNPTTLYAGTQTAGVWTRPLSQVVAVDEPNANVVTEFRLAQNYPNPFNPTTAITFQLPVVSAVTLTVYDMLGKEIAMLVDGILEAGIHEVHFNAEDLASGLYTYTMRANGNLVTKKMLLMK